MGSFVLLLKEFEDEKTVVYKFGPSEEVMEKILLNKITQKFSKVESLPDSYNTTFYFDRAAQKLAICLVREGGIFPERTTFES